MIPDGYNIFPMSVPSTTRDYTQPENAALLLPDYDMLDEYQGYIYDTMLEMLQKPNEYKHTGDGCSEELKYGKVKVLSPEYQADGDALTHCVGITYELFIRSHMKYMKAHESYLKPYDVDPKFWGKPEWHGRAYWFRYNSFPEYGQGAAAGTIALYAHLRDRWADYQQAEVKAGKEDPGDFLWYNAQIVEPWEMEFGAQIQLQYETNMLGRGHAVTFVGYEVRKTRDGKEWLCARVFDSNYNKDYGMKYGIKFSWYLLGRWDDQGNWIAWKNRDGSDRRAHASNVFYHL